MTARRKRLPRSVGWLGGAGAVLLVAGLLVAAAPAQESATGSVGQSVAPVFSKALPNLPGHTLTAVVVDYAPGGQSASHYHAGSVFAYVLDGAIRSQLDDGPEIVYQAGESFFEPPGTHHAVSANASDSAPARLLAVVVAPDGAELTTFDE